MKKQLFISGGIGNQMFEYAFYLSCKNKGIDISLNIDMYNVNRMHNGFMLGHAFNIPDDDILPSNELTTFLSRFMRRYMPWGLVYNEVNSCLFSEKAYYTKRPYINGVFIGERYFEDVKDDVHAAFTFQNIDSRNANLALRMSQGNSVSLHIRRGDYLKHPQYLVCDDKYYATALQYILDNVENPKFYIFSDNPQWCGTFFKQFKVDYHIVSHNQGRDSYKDMYLMTQCKHNIIANSTFSWWGAWLNKKSEKIVIAPKNWFHYDDYHANCPDWVLIETK